MLPIRVQNAIGEQQATRGRIPALDGLRGVLAVVVVAYHVESLSGSFLLFWPSQVAVWCFFVMSGLVLTRSYAGGFAVFAARRIARLWPVFAVTVIAAHLSRGTPLLVSELLWLPAGFELQGDFRHAANPPSWSLYVEAWATCLIPAATWFGRDNWRRGVLILPIWAVACVAGPVGFYAGLFCVGAWLGRWRLQSRALEAAPAQWLGRVSFSLYLSHWPILAVLGPWGVLAVLPVAWAVWWAVERPSIALSRSIGR